MNPTNPLTARISSILSVLELAERLKFELRHSYTSNLIPHTDVMTVARAVGHKNIAVTAKV